MNNCDLNNKNKMVKKELSFSEILQKNIDKHNKRQEESLRLMREIKERIPQEDLKENQINIMDLIK